MSEARSKVLTCTTITLKVHPDHCKVFPDPNGKGRKRIVVQVPVDEVYRAKILYGPNPRNQNLNTKVSNAIREGLTEKPGWFVYYNRGLVLNAKEARYDNRRQELVVEMERNQKNPWESVYGNLDGGHTNRVIIEQIESGWKNPSLSGEKQYVVVEVLTGIETEELSGLVGARNRNMPVNDLSLLVLDDKIEWLQEVLNKKRVGGKIAWRQFDAEKEIMGEDVIARLSLINPKLENKNRCYSSPGRIISELKADEGLMEGLKSSEDVAFEFLQFVDYLQASFRGWYAKAGTDRKADGFRHLDGITQGENRLVFLKETIDYALLKAWLLPLAFSFSRVVIAEKANPKLWRQIADKVGPELYLALKGQTDNVGRNYDKVGKSSAVWQGLAAIVWATYADYKLLAVQNQN